MNNINMNNRVIKNNISIILVLIICVFGSSALLGQSSVDASRQNAITNAVKKASPAVVGINVEEVVDYSSGDSFWDFFFGRGSEVVEGLGSGFIISDDGYVLTNYHVAGRANKIIVTMQGGEKYEARIIGADATSDIALLKIDTDSKLPYLNLAKSEDIIVGEWSIAFGNPFGLFDMNAKPTVTVGVVSNTGLDFVQGDKVYTGMVQTDAAISSGNSGGPLVNAKGDVIGMNTVIFSTATNRAGAGSIGIGWAIPSDRLRKISERLKSGKKINRDFWLGMDLQLMNERLKRRYNIKSDYGLLVTRTFNNSAATIAQLEPGDVILEIDNNKIKKNEDFYLKVYDGEVGDSFNLTVLRNGERLRLNYTLRERRYNQYGR